MRVTILGSGSRGNATLFEAGGSRVLVDAGVPVAPLTERAREAGIDLEGLDGILVTHVHGDHAAHTAAYARAFEAPVFLTQATRRGLRLDGETRTRVFGASVPFSIGSLTIRPLSVPHDAPQVAVVVEHEGRAAAIATDLGTVRDDLLHHLRGVSTLLIESNYDPVLLSDGPYPPSVQARVSSRTGHLSNAQAAACISELVDQVRKVVLVHVSENSNHPDLALASARRAIGRNTMGRPRRIELSVAHPTEPMSIDVPVTPGQLALPLGAPPQPGT